MKKRRWGDNDKHLWPFTWCVDSSKRLGVVVDSGAHEDGRGDCHVRFYFGRLTIICELPQIIPDYAVRRVANWDAATVARLGRDWYETRYPKEYGFAFIEGTLHVYYGAQTMDSDTDQNKCFFLPWRNYTHIRRSLYDTKGNHFYTERDTKRGEPRTAWEATRAIDDAVPKVLFEFDDFDGQRIIATTHIEEREWRFGTGLFRWLAWFRKPNISRSLSLEFSSEVGPEKGSWKGGTVGHSIEMLSGELHESAFRRYCEQEHRARYSQHYRLRYIGRIEPPKPATDPQCAVAS